MLQGNSNQYLPTFRHPSGPRVHRELASLHRLAGSDGIKEGWPDSLRPWMGNLEWEDWRGIYLWDPKRRQDVLLKAVEWSCEILGLRGFENYKSIRRGLYCLLRPWYERQNGGIAFVIVESCRDLILNRFQGPAGRVITIRQVPPANNEPRFWEGAMNGGRNRRATLQSGAEYYPKKLPMVTPDDRPLRDTQFSHTRFSRIVSSPGSRHFTRNWDCWCLATESEHRELMRSGAYPVQVLKMVGDRINPSRLMTWVVLDPRSGMTENYCLDFDPFRKALLTIRRAVAPLEMLTEMDPRLDRWLYKLLHGRDYVLDE